MSIALIAALVGAGVSGISSGVGASQAAQERKKAANLQAQRERDAKRLYDREYNQNYLDTDMAKTAINRSAKKIRDLSMANRDSAIKTGATTESQIAKGQSLNDAQSNMLSNLVDQGQRYRENIRNRYESKQDAFDQQNYNRIEANAQSKGAAWDNVSKAVGNAAQGFAAAYTPAASASGTGSSGFGAGKSTMKQALFGDADKKFSNSLSRIGSRMKTGNAILGI